MRLRLANPNIGTVNDVICCPGFDFCALANATSIDVAEDIQNRLDKLDRHFGVGDVKINISGCMNACGHHHVGNIGLLGVSKNGADWYQLERAGCLLGVELEATDMVADIEAMLPRLELVVLNFAAFADGRAYSQARLLCERFSFQGDIRAQVEVLSDQLAFMQRCGISQFCLADSEDADLALSAFTDISKTYQPELGQAVPC